MAAERGDASALGLQFPAVVDQGVNTTMKMEEEEPEELKPEGPGMFHVVTVNFPDTDRASLENAQRQLGRQIKEEGGGDGHSVADGRPEGKEAAAAWKSSGQTEPPGSLPGTAGDTSREGE
ncbi:UNVERIFIED_CONTAM: hypothetical protein K2H54_062099 [Gekko kuhli]